MFKKRYIPLLLPFLFFGVSQLGCLSFRMSERKQEAYLLEHQQQKPDFHTYRIGGRSMHYTHVGNDSLPLVVFVHGSPGSSSAFIDFLADTNLSRVVQMISVDRPGFGYSDFGKTEDSLAMQAKVLKPILEKYMPLPVILVGHSLGGPVIARTAMDYPDLVSGMIMVAPSNDPSLEPKEWFRKPMNWWGVRWMFPLSMVVSNQEILPLKGELEKMLPMWPHITCPVTVIQGDKDDLVNPGNAAFTRRMSVNSPEVDTVMVPGGSHFIVWSKKDLVVKEILKMVERVRKEQ